jgi:hypothetical protein
MRVFVLDLGREASTVPCLEWAVRAPERGTDFRCFRHHFCAVAVRPAVLSWATASPSLLVSAVARGRLLCGALVTLLLGSGVLCLGDHVAHRLSPLVPICGNVFPVFDSREILSHGVDPSLSNALERAFSGTFAFHHDLGHSVPRHARSVSCPSQPPLPDVCFDGLQAGPLAYLFICGVRHV